MKIKLTFLLLIICNTCFSQQKDILTNEQVVSLVKAGLSTSIIIATIQSSNTKFDVSANGMVALKKQGVSDAVIKAMIEKSANAPSQLVKQSLPTKNLPQNELAKLDPGIYYSVTDGKKTEQLEPNVFSQAKVGSGIVSGLTYGLAKTKAKAVLSGVSANMKIEDANPVFYFVFPKGDASEANTFNIYGGASSPNEFVLIKFKVINTSKAKGREVVTGSFGTYSGFSSGIDDQDKVPYKFTKLSTGIYKIYFEQPVAVGEYAFIYAGGTAGGMGGAPAQKAYDFSIAKNLTSN
jgi:hypothetical protein